MEVARRQWDMSLMVPPPPQLETNSLTKSPETTARPDQTGEKTLPLGSMFAKVASVFLTLGHLTYYCSFKRLNYQQ